MNFKKIADDVGLHISTPVEELGRLKQTFSECLIGVPRGAEFISTF